MLVHDMIIHCNDSLSSKMLKDCQKESGIQYCNEQTSSNCRIEINSFSLGQIPFYSSSPFLWREKCISATI